MILIPNYLYHYYEAEVGPFKTLSDLLEEQAEKELENLRKSGQTFASKRPKDYMLIRRELERMVRTQFIEKGGKPLRSTPISMTLGPCQWIKQWYKDGQELKIPIEVFDHNTISFTYGDIFPAMRYNDHKPYRKKVYTLEEIKEVVSIYGMPQEWNKNGENGPDRYIEVQVWCDVDIDNMSVFK
ncbi:hypothetical protein JHL18_21945 [Clostridium sp. YIM B02505]|uniref:Uncharacterized protein n=1 Tax=Clostridium yunnanense TaxID=2800325 RepID=A0ABS1EV90_9CLOT|nr:hypothetical protein [Clostridium yunnanense]MBK1813289.1 hypothetical protein [Clostridium yunnanense]